MRRSKSEKKVSFLVIFMEIQVSAENPATLLTVATLLAANMADKTFSGKKAEDRRK